MHYANESSHTNRSHGCCECFKSLTSNCAPTPPLLLQTSAIVAEHHGRPRLPPFTWGVCGIFLTHLTEEGARSPSAARDSAAPAPNLYSGGTNGCCWLYLGGPGAASSVCATFSG